MLSRDCYQKELKAKHQAAVQHNLVRAEHVAAEKLRQELRPYNFFLNLIIANDVHSLSDGMADRFVKLWLTGFLVMIPILIYLSSQSVPYDAETLGIDPMGLWFNYLAIFYFLVIPFCLLPFYTWQTSKPPTNLLLSTIGFSVQWCYENFVDSPVFEWEIVRCASIRQQPQLQKNNSKVGKHVVIEFESRHFSVNDRIMLGRLVRNKESFFGFANHHICLHLSLDAFTRENDREMFLNYLCRHLSQDQLDVSLIEENRMALEQHAEGEQELRLPSGSAKNGEAPTYTNMWLDDMHSARRRSVEPLKVGQKLQDGRYVIREKLATGGQAIVYRARDVSFCTETCDDKSIVLKEFILPVSAGSQVRNRSFENVKNEADVLSALDHPGIIKILDHFVEDHRAYLVLESVEGNTLRDIVTTNGALPDKTVAPLITSLCDILKYLHARQPPIVHRDISPDNLMLTADGTVKLLDFNVAQRMESNETKTVVGKHNYIAPEQFRGKPVPQSDLYSLGGTIFFLLTGTDPVPLSCSRPSTKEVESSFENLVAKMTQTDLEKRFKNVDEVLEFLTNPGTEREDSITLTTSEKHMA